MGEKFGLECGICTQIQAFNPQLRIQIEKTLELLTEEPFNSSLRTHKLKGDLDGVWSCSIDYDNRILF